MARGATNQAKQTFGQASGLFNTSNQNANGIYGPLLKSYQDEATNPQGIGEKGLNAENTASQQSIGGSVAGAVGQNNLMAARTRNKGGYQIANNESMRSGMRQNSQNAVENIAANERLKEQQRQEGLAGQHGLYNTNEQEQLGALGQETGATNAETNAGKSGWLQNMLQIIATLNPGYSKGGGFSFG